MTAEQCRLAENARRERNWSRWGPYLSERQWATIREDYSPNGDAWEYFPHDHARSRAYRWGEDGLLGITDRQCRLCFALALWNGCDPILKERLFGLTGPQGNHGEDVKECYYYLDATPTSSYLKALYKYPQVEFPYAWLVEENSRRGRHEAEFELVDTGVFDKGRYFDVCAEYAKADPNDILIRVTVANRGLQAATLHLLPTLWFRNTWSWDCTDDGREVKPRIGGATDGELIAHHASLGEFRLASGPGPAGQLPSFLFTENETNMQRLFGSVNGTPFVKDAFHRYVVDGESAAISPSQLGTKAAAHYVFHLSPGESASVTLRLFEKQQRPEMLFGEDFEQVFRQRICEADEFFESTLPKQIEDDRRAVARQAIAGLLWSKQFYHYVVRDWLRGDADQPPPPAERREGRNRDWPHLFNRDVISMPDKWEYPWYAAWDMAFHMIPMAKVDPDFAKAQLLLFLREWYMHPNGQIPAYEFALSDVNPPVHAWACWRVYKMTAPHGERDQKFLARAFQKLLINFTWWVNRKDLHGRHLFSGGFLGMDNIGVFDRNQPVPIGGHLEQADGTAWMAFYCGTMLSMALELARGDPAYEDVASKFFEHFVAIVDAMNTLGGNGLWSEDDGFYYDQIQANGRSILLRLRSMVGIVPLFAVEVLDDDVIQHLPAFRKRMQWFLDHRPDLARHIAYMESHCPDGSQHTHRLLAVPSRERLLRVLRVVLDEKEFLSPFGVRALSRSHKDRPFVCHAGGTEQRVEYIPGESNSGLFGGNSNWRGPIWFPVNFLLIEALERYHHYYGDELKIECPTGTGTMLNLQAVAQELSRRLVAIFLPDPAGRRPCHGDDERYARDPHWRELVLFHEYFHGDTGRGIGASHQTGWTALVASIVANNCESTRSAESSANQVKLSH